MSISPTNSIPKPAMRPPTFFTVSFLVKSIMNAPMPASVPNMTFIEIDDVPSIPSATICAVTVVPMLAPNIIVAA